MRAFLLFVVVVPIKQLWTAPPIKPTKSASSHKGRSPLPIRKTKNARLFKYPAEHGEGVAAHGAEP